MLAVSDDPDSRCMKAQFLDFDKSSRVLEAKSPLVNTSLAGKSFDAPTALTMSHTQGR